MVSNKLLRNLYENAKYAKNSNYNIQFNANMMNDNKKTKKGKSTQSKQRIVEERANRRKQ